MKAAVEIGDSLGCLLGGTGCCQGESWEGGGAWHELMTVHVTDKPHNIKSASSLGVSRGRVPLHEKCSRCEICSRSKQHNCRIKNSPLALPQSVRL